MAPRTKSLLKRPEKRKKEGGRKKFKKKGQR